MALSRSTASAAAALGLVLALALAGCGAPTGETDAGGTTTASPSPSPEETTDTDGETDDDTDDDDATGDGGGSDGGEDPAQDRVRTGPVAQYGGPAYGDQGVAEVVAAGAWCKTIAVFWGGGEPIPDGVRFTFEHAVADRPGLEVHGETCGSRGADRPCLGLTVEAGESGIFCSLLLRPSASFADGTEITFTGTLECPTAAICDAVAAREVEPGPPIVVTDPEPDGGDGESDQEQQDDQPPDDQQQDDELPEDEQLDDAPEGEQG